MHRFRNGRTDTQVRRRFGYPHVASTLALVVALGGGTA